MAMDHVLRKFQKQSQQADCESTPNSPSPVGIDSEKEKGNPAKQEYMEWVVVGQYKLRPSRLE
jgi:hypothetical protein